jgi:hypothetical protein
MLFNLGVRVEERAEHFWMAHREMSVATSTHAESLDAACLAVSDCAICHVDVRHEFLHHHGLRHKPPVTAILIHRGASAIREDDDDLGSLPARMPSFSTLAEYTLRF